MMNQATIAIRALLVCALLMPLSTIAQQKKAGADPAVGQALRKAQGLLQQLAEENAQLNEQLKALKEQVEVLVPKAQRLERVETELLRKSDTTAALGEQNRVLTERIQRDAARIKEQQDIAAKARQDAALLLQAVTEREQWIGACTDKNRELHKMNGELWEKYREKGVWQALKGGEPVTRIGRVAVEQEAQDYRFRLQDLQVTPLVPVN